MNRKCIRRMLPGLLTLAIVVTLGCSIGGTLAKYVLHKDVATLDVKIIASNPVLDLGYKLRDATRSAISIRFGNINDYQQFTWGEGTDISAAKDESIQIFSDSSNNYYVLSQASKIKANPNSSHMFENKSLQYVFDFAYVDTSDVTTMESMFENAQSLKNLNYVLASFNTSSVSSMESMFDDCDAVTNLDLSKFDFASVTTLKYFLYGLGNITSITFPSDIHSPMLENMEGMFCNCTSLQGVDISGFDTDNVTNMSAMFYGCKALTTLDISSIDTSSVTTISAMFQDANKLKTIYVGEKWDISNVTSTKTVFGNNKALVGGNGTKWNSEKVNTKDYARIDGKDGMKGYFTDIAAKTSLVSGPVQTFAVLPTPVPTEEVIRTLTVNTSELHGAYVAEVAAGRTTWNVGENVVLTLCISASRDQLPNHVYVNIGDAEYMVPTTQNLLGSSINSVGGITYNTETYQLTIPASMTTGDIAISAF